MEGGVSIVNDGGGGRLGSAARSTSSTSKRKSNKIADISGRNNILKSLRLWAWATKRITTPEASTGQWVILLTLEAESSEVTMTGTIFLAGTARRKSTGARSQVCRSMSGPTRRPSCAWLGVAWRRKAIAATSRGKRRIPPPYLLFPGGGGDTSFSSYFLLV